jgi:hypothetical protein
MIASAIIATLSLALLVYWFRYVCLLMLAAKPARDYAARVAAANDLVFVKVKSHLAGPVEPQQLDRLQRELDRDYRIVLYLLRQGANIRGYQLEQKLLMAYFETMKAAYLLLRRLRPETGRRALGEMTDVVAYCATRTGELAACAS